LFYFHRDAWGRVRGSVLDINGGGIVSQRFRLALKSLTSLYCETGKRHENKVF